MGKLIDLTGKTFGKWTVLNRDEEHSTKRTIMWKCQCSCENHTIKYISGESLRNGNSKSCGCIKSPDLAGQKFGRWTVLKRDNTIHKNDAYWICECSCDKHTIKSVSTSNLKTGNSKSCGCLANIDITGKTFGRWTSLKYDEERSTYKTRYWICECSCENHTIRSVSKSDLITGKSLSCGCLQKESIRERFVDLTGITFGRWIVLKFDEQRSNKQKKFWFVQCSCEKHTIKSINGSILKRGESQSCGCIHSPDLTGEKFNKLTVIEFDNKRYEKDLIKFSNGEIKKIDYHWLCQCKCGNITSVARGALVTGGTKSCGCLTSIMEAKAQKYFDTINLNYIKQYTYDDCIYKDKLKFDFYLPDYDCCIEFDGRQHFEPVRFNGKSLKQAEKDFKKQKVKDKIKDDYCKNNNIELIRISYLEFKNYKNILFDKLGIGGEICP